MHHQHWLTKELFPCVPESPDDRFVDVEDAALFIKYIEELINGIKKGLLITPGLYNLFLGPGTFGDVLDLHDKTRY